jgi:signal transduction histidine kinase
MDVQVIEQSEETVQRFTLEPDEHGGAVFVRGPRLERKLRIPRSTVEATVERFESRLLAGSLALLLTGLMATGFVVHRATRPLGELASAARRVGEGELGVSVEVRRGDEVGEAVTAFNAMSARLVELDSENRRLSDAEHLSELAEVARGLAHTLRNPLNALGLAVERLADERDPERGGELAERCRRQIRRIDGSLRSFLALASAPAAEPEAVEVGTLAREVALEALQDAGRRVRIDVDAPEPIELSAVGAELKAMIQALVVNACEASPEDGRVALRVRREGDSGVQVEVEDQGAGVAAEVAGRLFAPHVTTKPHGSGMGLYLARRLATGRYGGDAELAPRTPRGVRATLRLAPRREVEG